MRKREGNGKQPATDDEEEAWRDVRFVSFLLSFGGGGGGSIGTGLLERGILVFLFSFLVLRLV